MVNCYFPLNKAVLELMTAPSLQGRWQIVLAFLGHNKEGPNHRAPPLITLFHKCDHYRAHKAFYRKALAPLPSISSSLRPHSLSAAFGSLACGIASMT